MSRRSVVGVGYPRVIGAPGYQPPPGYALVPVPGGAQANGYVAGGYVAGTYRPGLGVWGEGDVEGAGGMPAWFQQWLASQGQGGHMPVHSAPHPHVNSAPWRAMVAPGTPPVGEGHVAMPLTAETDGGQWGAGGAGTGGLIIFSARPQKPFKTARLLVRGTKVGLSAVGNLIGEIFVGTDLQQGELGYIDLESIGAATAFDTWLSLKQAEPGVWIRAQCTLTAFPSGTDFEVYTVTALGHYLH